MRLDKLYTYSLVWYLICRYILILLPDNLFFQVTSWVTHLRFGYRFSLMNLTNPKSFSEKLHCLKKNPLHKRHTMLVDKVLVREFISQTIGEEYLVPCLGIYNNANEINFDELPSRFILKTNHGSGWNLICRDKSTFDKKKAIKRFERWLSFNAYYLSREQHYKNIKPLIICEQLLEYEIYDYKLFCFNGKPEFVQVDISRFSNHTRAFFNMKWEKLPFSILYNISEKNIPKPQQLEVMERMAIELSKNLMFARIDLYVHANQVFFGEITLIPEGGNTIFIPREYDLTVGRLMSLNQ